MREVMLSSLQLPYLRTDFDKYIDNDSDSDVECVPPLTLARGMYVTNKHCRRTE